MDGARDLPKLAPSPRHEGSPVPARSHIVALCLLVLLASAAKVAGHLPEPTKLLRNPDIAHQMAGALQIDHGEHPFVDWRSTYGPAVFYASWLARELTGERLAGEFLLCALGFGAAAVLFFLAGWRLSGRAGLALLAVALSLFLLPRFYKYYMWLGPAFVMFSLLRRIEEPSRRREIELGVAIALAGLFRPDLGAWSALACFGALAVLHGRRCLLPIARLAGWTLAAAAPWLLFCLVNGALVDYLRDSSGGSLAHAAGLSLPFPVYDPRYDFGYDANRTALGFLAAFAMPLVALAWAVWRWRHWSPERRASVAGLWLLATLGLTQALHRSDGGHLLQALLPSLLLYLWLAGEAWRGLRGRPSPLPRTAAGATLLCIVVAVGLQLNMRPRTHDPHFGTRQAIQWLSGIYWQGPRGYFAQLQGEYEPTVAMMLVDSLQEQLPPAERLLALPFMPQLNVVLEMPFAAGQMLLTPGYFSTRDDQRRMVERLREQGHPPVLEMRNALFDGRKELEVRLVARYFFNYLGSEYRPYQQAIRDPNRPGNVPGQFTLWMSREEIRRRGLPLPEDRR